MEFPGGCFKGVSGQPEFQMFDEAFSVDMTLFQRGLLSQRPGLQFYWKANTMIRKQLGILLWILGMLLPVCFTACSRSQPADERQETKVAEPAQQTALPVAENEPAVSEPTVVNDSVDMPVAAINVTDRVLALLPDFELTDQEGSSFSARQLYTKVWVANFMFTRCSATCPAQTAKMKELQRKLERHPEWNNIRLVSFSVDPEHDTSDVLGQYAVTNEADTQHWKFLTGTRDAMWELSRQGFKMAVGEADDNPQMPIFHSQMFVLVDPYLRVRGFYDVLSGDGTQRLQDDIDKLLRERLPQPPEILNTTWLEPRRQAQLRTVDQFEVNYNFSLTDQIEDSGIKFRGRIVDDAGRNYKASHYDHGSGVAIADVDGDGRSDLYFVNQVGKNGLWKNLGNGHFTDITEQSGTAMDQSISVGGSFADIDNDGDADLYVTTVRNGNVLLENDGTGKFTDISSESGLDHVGHSSGAVFFDFDRDGLLDVFVTNVGKYTTDELALVTRETVSRHEDREYKYYTSFPDAFAGHLKPEERNEKSLLFRNLGGNRFEDVSKTMKLEDVSWTGDATPVDFNRDGWTDLYVLNMQGHDEYYENLAGKEFRKASRDLFPSTSWGFMGVKSFDYDNDGDLDLFVTDMHSDMSQLVDPGQEKTKAEMIWPESLTLADGQDIWGNAFYRNDGEGKFVEVSDQIGAENYWPWGISVGDLNADGFDDVFVASSMNYAFRYGVNSVLLNNRGKRFLDSEFLLGVEPRQQQIWPWYELELAGRDRNSPMSQELTKLGAEGRVTVWAASGSRSSVIFDLDDDGDLDIVTNEFNGWPMVLISDLSEKNEKLRFLKIKLIGKQSNRDGLGASVTVQAAGKSYLKVYDGQSGYLSHSLYPLYFGLDGAESVDQVEVVWPSGTTQTVQGPIDVNTTIVIQEE